jgi:hypothetical protein
MLGFKKEAASFYGPGAMAFDSKGNLFVVDSNRNIREIDTDGIVTTVVGLVGNEK